MCVTPSHESSAYLSARMYRAELWYVLMMYFLSSPACAVGKLSNFSRLRIKSDSERLFVNYQFVCVTWRLSIWRLPLGNTIDFFWSVDVKTAEPSCQSSIWFRMTTWKEVSNLIEREIAAFGYPTVHYRAIPWRRNLRQIIEQRPTSSTDGAMLFLTR